MAYRVLQGFDIQRKADPTKSRRLEPGDVIEDDDLEVADHIEWMVADGQLAPVGAETEETDDGSEVTKSHLQDLARENDLPVSGTKADLVERLTEAGVEVV